MKTNSVFIERGYSLVVVAGDLTSGSYTRDDIPGGTDYTPDFFVAGSTTTLGPFNEPRTYTFRYQGADPTYTLTFSGMFTGSDDTTVVHTTDDITALTPLAETNVADIEVDADGTEIATAVNGILAILVAAGLMEEGV